MFGNVEEILVSKLVFVLPMNVFFLNFMPSHMNICLYCWFFYICHKILHIQVTINICLCLYIIFIIHSKCIHNNAYTPAKRLSTTLLSATLETNMHFSSIIILFGLLTFVSLNICDNYLTLVKDIKT